MGPAGGEHMSRTRTPTPGAAERGSFRLGGCTRDPGVPEAEGLLQWRSWRAPSGPEVGPRVESSHLYSDFPSWGPGRTQPGPRTVHPDSVQLSRGACGSLGPRPLSRCRAAPPPQRSPPAAPLPSTAPVPVPCPRQPLLILRLCDFGALAKLNEWDHAVWPWRRFSHSPDAPRMLGASAAPASRYRSGPSSFAVLCFSAHGPLGL